MTQEEVIEICAKATHEMNRVYCQAMGEDASPPWDDAGDQQRECLRKGVRGAFAGNTPQMSHEGWMRERLAQGWKLGPVKDIANKISPCLVPYDQLPPAQLVKDALFLATVKAMANALTVV